MGVGVARGQIVWVCFAEPAGRRPAVVISGDDYNQSALETVLVLPLTTNERLALMPGNVVLTKKQTGLPRDSVVNVTQMQVVHKQRVNATSRRLTDDKMRELWSGINLVLGSPFLERPS